MNLLNQTINNDWFCTVCGIKPSCNCKPKPTPANEQSEKPEKWDCVMHPNALDCNLCRKPKDDVEEKIDDICAKYYYCYICPDLRALVELARKNK